MIDFGLSLALAILVLVLTKEVRLRRALQRLVDRFVELGRDE